MPEELVSRRRLISTAGVAGVVAAGGGIIIAQNNGGKKNEQDEDVSPAEDLMREHGVLKRVLLIYRDVINRIDNGKPIPPDTLSASAKLIRDFIENYHEKLEEDYLFPRFKKANKHVDLVNTLQLQHQRGRLLTQRIISMSNEAGVRDTGQRAQLKQMLHLFVRMYEPHEAREDTVLFPAFRKLVSKNEYAALGEEFEKKEHQLFGKDGFEKKVDLVARLEKELGLFDLAQFTPPS